MRHLQPCKVSDRFFCHSLTVLIIFRCLGIEHRKGTLRAGADADLAVLDRRGNVLSTWVAGKKVWSKD